MEFTRSEFILYTALAGMAAGFLLGLIPLIAGIRKGKTRLGILGLIVTTIVGTLGLLLSVPSAVVFTWLVLKRPDVAS